MNYRSLSNQELDENLRALQSGAHPAERDELQQAIQQLEAHRIEFELHQRAMRETQAELERSVQRYADLYDHLPMPYLTVTPAGQIVRANRAATEWLRGAAGGLVDSSIRKLFDPYDAGRLAAHLENCACGGAASTIELTLRLSAGETAMVQIATRPAPANPEAKPLVHLAIADLTKLKQAQRVLEDINREQEAFNYSISHDLRAPLVTINNYASIVLGEHAGQLDEEGRVMVERIRAAAARMEEMLKRLLAYSTLAREPVTLEPVNIETVIKELLIEHRTQITERQAEIQVEGPLLFLVRGAPGLLSQVFANLLSNALKYTAPDEAPRVRIFAGDAGEKVTVSVADQGIGIDPRYLERVFKIFERLHGYSRYPGSGVGLAIARRAVERMNGRIWCESAPGQGCCFRVELPKA